MEIDKEKVIECSMDIQRHVLKGVSAEQSLADLEKKYDKATISIAMEFITASKTDERSPYKHVTEVVSRCMNSVKQTSSLDTPELFYEQCERIYKVFMNDEEGRGLPIVFLWNKGVKSIGVSPIIDDGMSKKSPMDKLRSIVYSASPDAYCFCAEASMIKREIGEDSKKLLEKYEYGRIINDPESEDIVVLQGNNKTNTAKFSRAFTIEEKDGKVKLKLIDDYGENLESSKLP